MDIFLSVLTFLLVAATSYLGVHVTLHPADTPGAKRFYKIAFVLGTLLAAGSIGWQAYLGRVSQAALQAQLNKIQHNTETPPPAPIVNVAPPAVIIPPPPLKHAQVNYNNPAFVTSALLLPYHEGQQPAVNIGNYNGSDVQILGVTPYGKVVVVPTTDIQESFRRYRPEMRKDHSVELQMINPRGDIGYRTYLAAPLTADDVKQLNSGQEAVCALGMTIWRDESGRYETDFGQCYVAEGDTAGSFNWHILSINQREVKLK